MMIRRLFIANRGEIAVRVIRTCREMGIESVAAYSDADRNAPFVRAADAAVRVGPAPASESYLAIDALVAAARASGADAVHPGYGFLAENADFAAAVEDAGLIFVGPTPEVIRTLGSKLEAKRIAAAAGVPNIPTYDAADPGAMRFPVLLKASAGGGGKGMTVVRRAADLPGALDSARRLAASAFGDDTILIEKLIDRPRHVEIQILGDGRGEVVHLGERECSIQRRHQKIVEESPSPALDDALRGEMTAAAVALARQVDYRGAGTVEMILAPGGEFYFLEVNTRLQVEHPVTELVWGVDLVREQIRVAEGRGLSFAQDEIAPRGWAIECRLYAEDPAAGDLPQSGAVIDYAEPAGIRVDSGIERGSEITVHYDPMLAKLIAVGADRDEAARRLWRALGELRVAGVATNRAFLRRLFAHPEFLAGDIDTGFVDRHRDELAASAAPEWAAIAATASGFLRRRRGRELLPALEPGFRNSPFAPATERFRRGDAELEVAYRNLGAGRLAVRCGSIASEIDVAATEPGRVELACAVGHRRRFAAARGTGGLWWIADRDDDWMLEAEPRFPEAAAARETGSCLAPMPGKVVAVEVAVGAAVEAGQTLVVLEAMKMEHAVTAPHAGEIAELPVVIGEQVDGGAVLVVVRPSE
jgi:acetyl/propionyl-CoA carboxylase alpha subunit